MCSQEIFIEISVIKLTCLLIGQNIDEIAAQQVLKFISEDYVIPFLSG
jgi:hypothetical protein